MEEHSLVMQMGRHGSRVVVEMKWLEGRAGVYLPAELRGAAPTGTWVARMASRACCEKVKGRRTCTQPGWVSTGATGTRVACRGMQRRSLKGAPDL